MADEKFSLPSKILLSEYEGNYAKYIDAVYAIFERDFIKHKAKFGTCNVNLKFNPLFQSRAYTFYHMTHKGEVEDERIPDLRRCECMSWARPVIENTETWNLKFWRQERKGKQRICILIENPEDVDYFVVLDIRSSFILLWTAFVAEYKHETKKKLKEYYNWSQEKGEKFFTPDSLVKEIMQELQNKQGSPIA